MIAAATVFAVTAGACGSDDGGSSTYEATREGEEAPETRPPDTGSPRTSTPGTIVLPTFPTSTTDDAPTTTGDTPASTEPPASTDAPASTVPGAEGITVTGTWFADDGYGGVDWGATYENTASTPTEFVEVEARLLDADGAEIGTSTAYVSLLLPGTGAVADYEYDLEGTVASIEVSFLEGEPSEFAPAGELTVGGLAYDETISAATGTITSTYAADLDDATVVGVWRDGAGEITAIAEDYVRLVLANGVTVFSLSPPGEVEGAPAEVFVTPRPEPYEVTAPDASLVLAESWHFGNPSDGYSWGAIVTNSGTGSWSGPYATARFFDAEGRLVAADDAYLSYARPGDNAALGYVWSTPADVARVEVALTDGGSAEEPPAGELTVGDVAVDTSGSTPTVTGTVTSSFTEAVSYPQVILVWRDAAGAVSYATSTFPDEIAAGGSVPMEVPLYDDGAPTTPPTETYWSA